MRRRRWDARQLARIRLGVMMGRYHAGFPFDLRCRELLAASDVRELSLYERGLLAGYRPAARTVDDDSC